MKMDHLSIKTALSISAACALTACTSMQVNHSQAVALPNNDRVVVFPLSNLTETPQADEKATAIASNLLRIKGFHYVQSYTPKPLTPSLIPGVKAPVKMSTLMRFANESGAHYALTGSVSEWNYKVGMDGEPVVGINLELIDVHTGKPVWSAVGSQSGGSREAVSEVAIHLMNNMLDSIQTSQG